MSRDLTPITEATADGYYVSRDLFIRTSGQDNFDVGVNLDDDATVADEEIAQGIFDLGDQYVDQRALILGVTAANENHYVADDTKVFTFLRYWASRWARAQAFLLRGTTGNPDQGPEGQMTAMKLEAEKRIDELLATLVTESDAKGVGEFGFVELGTACTTDENAGLS